MRWARLILAVVLVVGWTSTAAAECAWVLWEHAMASTNGDPILETWGINNAFEQRKECLDERRLAVNASAELKRLKGAEVSALPDRGVVIWTQRIKGRVETGGTAMYSCFPDTLDPREKEK